MSHPPTYLRQLNVGSGVVSGVAALIFDIIVLSIIKAQAQYLCCTANLYQIYDRRNCISPTTSRLGCLTGSPTGHITLARYFSLLIAASTAAVIVLGFSINGKSIKTFETITYRSAVVAASVPLNIDYDREYVFTSVPGTPPRREVSRRIVAVFDLYTCAQNNFTHTTQYSYAYRNLHIDDSMVSYGNRLPEAECITKPRFESDHVLRQVPMPAATRAVIQCQFRGFNLSMKEDEVTGHATFSPSSNCIIKVPRLQCFRKQGTSCAGVGTIEGDARGTYLVVVPNMDKPNITTGSQIPPVERAHHERLGTNAAFFARIFADAEAYYIGLVLFSTVTHRPALSRAIGTREVSEIDMRYAAPTLVFVSSAVMLLAIAVLISWKSVVYTKKRGQYNTFCTVPEVLALADYGGTSKMRYRNGDHRFIGMQSDMPVLGVMNAEECNNAKWTEDEIQ